MTQPIAQPVNTPMMFDPIRIRTLYQNTQHCVESLGRISLPDPAADHAIAACRNISLTLTEMWLPMIRDVLALTSLSEYESAFHNQPTTVHSHYSSRFAPRWAGRARSAAARRERALRARAALTPCDPPWLKRAPQYLTTWTWSELKEHSAALRIAILRGADITEPLRALEQTTARMASEAISHPSNKLMYPTSHSPKDREARAALDEYFSMLNVLGGPGLHNINEEATDQFSRASQAFGPGGAYGALGASATTILNFWIADSRSTSPDRTSHNRILHNGVGRNEGVVPMIVRNGGLLNIIVPNLHALEYPQLVELAAGVLEETARLHSVTTIRTGPPVAFAVGPIMAEILSRPGGVTAIIASPSARSALFGRPVAPGPEFRTEVHAALSQGAKESEALSNGHTTDPAMSLEERAKVFELMGLFSEDVSRLKLHPAVSRSLAVTFGPVIGDLLPHLEETGTVIVTLLPSDGSAPRQITLGTYQGLAGVFGHIMHDPTSQMVLGLAVGQVITDQSQTAAQWLLDNPEFPDPMRHIESTFADSRRGITLLTNGRTAHDDHLEFALGLSMSRSITAVNVASLFIPPARVPTSRILNLTFPMLMSALGLDEITPVPSLGLESDLAILYSTSALRIPIDNPDLRGGLGLSGVPTATWDRYEALIEEIEQADAPTVREEKMSVIRAMLRQDPDLHGYLNSVRSGSGDL